MMRYYFIQVLFIDKQNYLKGIVVRISIIVHCGKIKIWMLRYVAQKNSIYEHTFIIKEVKQDQVLTKIEGSKDQKFEE